MTQCPAHPEWHLPNGGDCPDCLLEYSDSVGGRVYPCRDAHLVLLKALAAAIATFPETWWREHLRLIALRLNIYSALKEARIAQPLRPGERVGRDIRIGELIPWRSDI